jgi:hypothetical protein
LEGVTVTKEDEETKEVLSTQVEEEDTEVEVSAAEEAAADSRRIMSLKDAARAEEVSEECFTDTRQNSKMEEKEVVMIST